MINCGRYGMEKKKYNISIDFFLIYFIINLNNIGKAKTERVVYPKHPERRALFGGSLL
jgi:hypothetical protein